MPSTTKLGRYEVFEELGSGSMGTVFRGRDPMIDRFVAIKTIRMQGFAPGETEGFRERFIREAQAAGKLSHPGIVTIYDVGTDDETRTPYLVMEFVAGKTLDQLIRESSTPLPVEKSLGIVKQIAEALDYAHAQGIVHRDIKPANIILTPAGRAIIMDFGVARLRKSQLTMQGEVIGTPSFMSPEQVRGERVDGRADLFSLGVILYWMLTREKPFTGEIATIMYKIVHEDPVLPATVNPGLSPDFDAVVARSLAKTREARYQTGDEFAGDLDCLLTGQTVHTPAPAVAAPAVERTVQLPAGDLPGAAAAQRPLRERSGDIAASLSARLRKQIAEGTSKFKSLSRPAQTVAAALALLVLTLIAWSLIPSPQSRMLVLLQHNFKSGSLSVWVDNKLVVKEPLVYDEVRRFPFSSSRYVGRFSQNVPLRAGARNIRVQVASSDPAFDETRKLDGDFPENGQLTLSISCDSRRNSLTVSLR